MTSPHSNHYPFNHYPVYTDLDKELKAVYSYSDNKEPAKMPCCQSDRFLITHVEKSNIH